MIDVALDFAIKIGESICNAIPSNICAAICVTNPVKPICFLAITVIKLVKKIFNLFISPAAFHNGAINSAETNSILKNTQSLLTATCGMEELIQVETDEVDDSLDKGFCDVIDPNDPDTSTYGHISTCNIYHEVLCRVVPNLQPGHGKSIATTTS